MMRSKTILLSPSPQPPSSSLPALSRLHAVSGKQLHDALDGLKTLYWHTRQPLPSKLTVPIRKHLQTIHDDSVPDSGYASADDEDDMEEQYLEDDTADDEAVEILRADVFERAFAIKWVTGFIARADGWVDQPDADVEEEEALRAEAVEKAIAVLAAFTGNDEEAEECDLNLTRTFTFSGGIRVELNDAPVSTEDHTSVGLQSWGSAIVQAEKMCEDPVRFGLGVSPRVLELGAGTGLLSITAASILQRQGHLTTPIYATDFHPAVLANLTANVNTNFPSSASPSSHPPVSVEHLDWETPDYTPFGGAPFDVILAADVIYHPEHARWIKAVVEAMLVRPSKQKEGGSFWLMKALRTTGRHEGMDDTVHEVFPLATSAEAQGGLGIIETESFEKRDGVGRADESGYRLYKIGWVL